MSSPRRLVPLELAAYPPGTRCLGWVGRDCRAGANAPGRGPAAWTEVEVVEWSWPRKPEDDGDLVACGVLAVVVGARGKRLRFNDPALLASLPQVRCSAAR